MPQNEDTSGSVDIDAVLEKMRAASTADELRLLKAKKKQPPEAGERWADSRSTTFEFEGGVEYVGATSRHHRVIQEQAQGVVDWNRQRYNELEEEGFKGPNAKPPTFEQALKLSEEAAKLVDPNQVQVQD